MDPGFRPQDRMVLGATEPLTRNEPWVPFAAGELLVFVDDESEDWAETRAFLARRIEGVMRFERAKAQWKGIGAGERLSFARFIGRLRYPAI